MRPFTTLSLALGAQGSGSGFSLKDISGLVWSLRADKGISLVSGAVDIWADQSGIGDSARNAGTASGTFTRPGFTASNPLYNGRPTVGPFDAGASVALRTGTLWNATYSAFTLLVVGHAQATSTRYFLLPSASVFAGPVNKAGQAVGFVGSTPKEVNAGPKSLSAPTYAIFDCNFTAGANGKMYVGQTTVANASLDISAEPVSLGANGLHIGGHPTSNLIFRVTDIAEVAAWNKSYSAFTAPERAQLALYMARYGL